MEPFENQPPSWAMIVFRIIVHPEFQEEIEGDLLEKYRSDLRNYGPKMARRRLYAELFSMAKPNLIFNVNRTTMKPRNWLLLLLLPLLVAVASVAPFLPSPSNNLSHGISQFAQTIGYIGWPFVPFGLGWLIIEMRNKNGQQLNRWSNGYYPSWLTLIPVFTMADNQGTARRTNIRFMAISYYFFNSGRFHLSYPKTEKENRIQI